MGAVKIRRAEYAESTRRALLDTGLRLFVEQGYTAVSAEELVRAAGLTRGALYHHFDGKRGLFEAVFEEQQEKAARRITEATANVSDPWQWELTAMGTFYDICADRDYREIVLLQGPIALGWPRWRELDQIHLAGLITEGVNRLQEAGIFRPQPPNLVAAALVGALTELSLVVATADDPQQARDQVMDLAVNMLRGFMQ